MRCAAAFIDAAHLIHVVEIIIAIECQTAGVRDSRDDRFSRSRAADELDDTARVLRLLKVVEAPETVPVPIDRDALALHCAASECQDARRNALAMEIHAQTTGAASGAGRIGHRHDLAIGRESYVDGHFTGIA